MIFNLTDFTYEVICDSDNSDVRIETVLNDNKLDLYISAVNDKPKFIKINWKVSSSESEFIVGDAWEDLNFRLRN